VLVLLNLCAAVAIATWPARQADVATIQRWGHEWLAEGLNVYAVDWDWPDYPPHALILLAPLSWFPKAVALPLWAGLNVALAAVTPYLAIRAVHPAVAVKAAWLPMLMFLCWGGFRTLLQFTLLTLAFALAAIVLSTRNAGWSGAALGCALMKPQISFPFFLWAVLTRRLRMAGVALAVVAGGFVVFSIRAGTNPLEVVRRFVFNLRVLYTGDTPHVGAAQLRPLFAAFVPDYAVVDLLVLGAAIALFAVVCALGMLEMRARRVVWYGSPALAALWCMLTFHHLTNGFIMLLPMAAALIYADEPETLRLRRAVFWILQIGMVLDVPSLLNRFARFAPSIATGPLLHFDRVLILVLFALTLTLGLRSLRLAPRRL
jgi:hypothetical protein